MEEERINTPYYETTYLDDFRNKHIVNIKDKEDLDFYNDRFTILSCSYKED